jgi:signal transduction histidine kinase
MWVAVVGHISLYQLNRISDPLSDDIPESVESIRKTTYLDGLAQFVRYYDEVLTQSARNYAFTRDEKWQRRYREIEPELESAISKAIEQGKQQDSEFFSTVNKVRHTIAEIESKAIELVNRRQPDEAVRMLESRGYWEQKTVFENELDDYISRRGIQYDQAVSSSSKAIDLATKRAQKLIKTSERLVLIFGVIAVVLSVGSGLLISRSIYVPLFELKAAADEIGRGNMDTPIEVKSNDEVGQLAESFRKMVIDLQKTTTSMDNLNQEILERKKAEESLRLACADLEKANKELKEMQSQLVQSEKLASIGQLAAGVAHEMNTPVGFVASNFETLENYMEKILELFRMYGELLGRAEGSDNAELLEIAAKIEAAWKNMKIDFILDDLPVLFTDSKEGIGRVTSIVQNLRDFSRIEQPENFDTYNINDGIKATLIVAQNEIKYDAAVEKELSEVPDIVCNTGQINQVLLNIIMNAVQAIKSEEREDKGKITIRTYATADDVVCEISDDGPGIEADKLQKIFDPFFTTKPVGMGTGLGLSISYDIIVIKHKGMLLVDNSVGKGTKFTIKLPINKKEEKDDLEEKRDSSKESSAVC